MIIRETKADELKAARDAWEAEYDKAEAEYDAQEQKYEDALYTIMHNIEDEIKNQLSDLDIEHLEITADPFGGSFGTQFKTGVKFEYGETYDHKTSLKWSAKIYIDNSGNVIKETSSWSGLEATTDELISDLKNSVQIIERIMNLDWETIILNAEASRPKRKDFITGFGPSRRDRPDFESQIAQAEVDDIIGTDKLIKGYSIPNMGYRYTVTGYYKIHSQTPKRLVVSFIPERYIENKDKDEYSQYINRELDYTQQISKDKFFKDCLAAPVETIEI